MMSSGLDRVMISNSCDSFSMESRLRLISCSMFMFFRSSLVVSFFRRDVTLSVLDDRPSMMFRVSSRCVLNSSSVTLGFGAGVGSGSGSGSGSRSSSGSSSGSGVGETGAVGSGLVSGEGEDAGTSRITLSCPMDVLSVTFASFSSTTSSSTGQGPQSSGAFSHVSGTHPLTSRGHDD